MAEEAARSPQDTDPAAAVPLQGGSISPPPPPPNGPPNQPPSGAAPLPLEEFRPTCGGAQSAADEQPKAFDPESIDLLADVNLNVKIELGRTRMMIEDILRLSDGSVVELNKLAGDPVDVFVNDRLVARGEVLVLNDNFCVRINEIVGPLIDRVAI